MGREGGEGGGGQCGAGEQQVGRDGGEDEERQGRPAAEVRQDGGGDYLPRRPSEDVGGLDGGEDGGEDGGVREACCGKFGERATMMAMEPQGRETTDGRSGRGLVMPWLCREAEVGARRGGAGGHSELTGRPPVVLVSAVLQHLHAARSPQGVEQHVVQRVLTVLPARKRAAICRQSHHFCAVLLCCSEA